MNETAAPGEPKLSPSGKYRLLVFDDRDAGGNPSRGFRVEHRDGQEILAPSERWSLRHRLYFLWGEGDRVWVYSGDVGTSIWEWSDGMWRSIDYVSQRGRGPPEFLRRTLPRDFP
jgi:hypothetical protein